MFRGRSNSRGAEGLFSDDAPPNAPPNAPPKSKASSYLSRSATSKPRLLKAGSNPHLSPATAAVTTAPGSHATRSASLGRAGSMPRPVASPPSQGKEPSLPSGLVARLEALAASQEALLAAHGALLGRHEDLMARHEALLGVHATANPLPAAAGSHGGARMGTPMDGGGNGGGGGGGGAGPHPQHGGRASASEPRLRPLSTSNGGAAHGGLHAPKAAGPVVRRTSKEPTRAASPMTPPPAGRLPTSRLPSASGMERLSSGGAAASNHALGEGHSLRVCVRKRPPKDGEADCVECGDGAVVVHEDKVKVDLTKCVDNLRIVCRRAPIVTLLTLLGTCSRTSSSTTTPSGSSTRPRACTWLPAPLP
jgi:hypothetical protein